MLAHLLKTNCEYSLGLPVPWRELSLQSMRSQQLGSEGIWEEGSSHPKKRMMLWFLSKAGWWAPGLRPEARQNSIVTEDGGQRCCSPVTAGKEVRRGGKEHSSKVVPSDLSPPARPVS